MIDSRTLIILADYKNVSTVGVVTFLLVWVFACFLDDGTKFGGWGKII